MQRLLLELTWEGLEDAGLPQRDLEKQRVGVFVGGFTLDNKLLQMGSPRLIDSHTATGITMCILANRISHIFNFRGPSITLDTACSSSLVATHLAVNSLRNGECEVAIVGGASVMTRPEYPITMSKASLLSEHGRCKAFSEDAAGYVRGAGAGVVILKPLSLAIENGDRVDAVLAHSGTNQDGRTAGISLPSSEAQEALIREVYSQAGVSPAQLSYVEAHGTGTQAGDPAEVLALSRVLAKREVEDTCYLGSVKTNVGHLEAAAGIAGLIKAALVMKHKTVPPNLHFDSPNPKIPFESTCLSVPVEVTPLDQGRTHYASVNSFGYGGSNAHVVLRSGMAVEGLKRLVMRWSPS
jgi:acyl transferase domain-containing protein